MILFGDLKCLLNPMSEPKSIFIRGKIAPSFAV